MHTVDVNMNWLNRVLRHRRNRGFIEMLGGREEVLGLAWEAANKAKGKGERVMAEAVHRALYRAANKKKARAEREERLDTREAYADPHAAPGEELTFADTPKAQALKRALAATPMGPQERAFIMRVMAGESVTKAHKAEKMSFERVRRLLDYIGEVVTVEFNKS
jgi:hypothetical protein